MSAVASFTKLPKSAVDALRKAAVPKKRLLFGTRDDYHAFLRRNGQAVADYPWSGYVLATLLPFLEEEHQINLMKSEYGDLAGFLTKARSASHFILTEGHKRAYLGKLAAPFSEAALAKYYSEFNQTDEPDIGKAMLDGIRAFEQCLSAVDANSIIVLGIE